MLSQGTGRTIKDGDVISVVRKFLVSGVMIDDEYEDTVVGTPQWTIVKKVDRGMRKISKAQPRHARRTKVQPD